MNNSRLSYEDSCKVLQKNYIDSGHIPPLPSRIPRYDDPEPTGVSLFRTFIGEGDDLSNLTLPRTFIGRTEINNALFKNTNLSESSICWNDLTDVDFTDAILSQSDMRASNFTRVLFVRANLTGVDLRQSTFENCSFEQAIVTGVILTKIQGQMLKLSDLQHAVIDWRDSAGEEPEGG
jgi:uncharacterized protein YjbI with pentapeptide repeats